MNEFHCVSHSYEETLALSEKFARALRMGDIVCLYGDLGAGKTAFVKGLAKGMKLEGAHVHSPTFTLMNLYDADLPLYHFDLYRITANDLFNIGYEEFFYGQGVTAVEWSERLGSLTPKKYWKVELKHAGEDNRDIRISWQGEELRERSLALGQALK